MVSCGQVCRPKEESGLEVLNLRVFNLALGQMVVAPIYKIRGIFSKIVDIKTLPNKWVLVR